MSQPTMREFALLQTAVLLRRLAFEINRAARNGDAAAVHDLRVAIRRFSRCLRAFAQFFPPGSWKKIRRHLAGLMEAAAAVRDRDIALQLLAEAGLPPKAAVALRLGNERRQAGFELQKQLRHFRTGSLSRKWRHQLELKP